jgi:hypothetical protein
VSGAKDEIAERIIASNSRTRIAPMMLAITRFAMARHVRPSIS